VYNTDNPCPNFFLYIILAYLNSKVNKYYRTPSKDFPYFYQNMAVQNPHYPSENGFIKGKKLSHKQLYNP